MSTKATLAASLLIPFLVIKPLLVFGQQNYPNKPIRVVVPTAPGSVTDTEGRIHLSKLQENIKQPVVLDFKTGGGGIIGLTYAAKSAPDGYTLLLVTSAFSMLPLMDDVPFDRSNAFAPVSLLSKRWAVVAVHPSMPSTAASFVAYAKANPEKVNYGTSGAGRVIHITGAWIESITGIKMTFVHYRGGGAMQPDLIAGRVHVAPMALTSALPYWKAGKIKILGLANLVRNPALPDVPTLVEQGWPDFEYVSWLGIVAPGKTPAPIINNLSSELAEVVKSPDIVNKLAGQTQLVGSTPQELRRTIEADTARWRKLVKEHDIKLKMY